MPTTVPASLPTFEERVRWACELRQVDPTRYLQGVVMEEQPVGPLLCALSVRTMTTVYLPGPNHEQNNVHVHALPQLNDRKQAND